MKKIYSCTLAVAALSPFYIIFMSFGASLVAFYIGYWFLASSRYDFFLLILPVNIDPRNAYASSTILITAYVFYMVNSRMRYVISRNVDACDDDENFICMGL